MRTICQSRTYQLSIIPNKWNEDDTINFSHASPRRLSAEQMLDAVAVATGVRPQFSGMPAGMRAVEIPDGTVAGQRFPRALRPAQTPVRLRMRAHQQHHAFARAESHQRRRRSAKPINSPSSRIAKLVETEKDDKKLIEEIYLSCLNRLPTDKEIAAIDFEHAKSRPELAQDLTWALINSPAFVFNR